MEDLITKALELLTSVQGSAVTIAVVLEFVFRMIPSAKPLSIAHIVAAAARGIGAVLTKLADILDKVLPQKVKTEELQLK